MSKDRKAYDDYDGPRISGKKLDIPAVSEEIPDAGNNGENAVKDSITDSVIGMSLLAPPGGTPIQVVHGFLDFAPVGEKDVLYDFGCGDGRLLLESLVKKKCRQCVGVEMEQDFVTRAKQLIQALPLALQQGNEADEGESKRIQIIHADLREVMKQLLNIVENTDMQEVVSNLHSLSLPKPTVVYVHLSQEGLETIEKDLIRLLPHVTIICAVWEMKDIRPIEEKRFHDRRTNSNTTLYRYTNECFERLKGFDYMLSVYNFGH